MPKVATRSPRPKTMVAVAAPAKNLSCLGPTFVRNSSEAAGVKVLTPGPTADRKKATPPSHAMAETMWRKVRTAMTVGSANLRAFPPRLDKTDSLPKGVESFIYASRAVPNVAARRKSIRVLRVGQRYVRDERTLTHLCLVSRALGAESIYLEDAEKEVLATLEGVNSTWGGDFKAELGASWRSVFKEAKKEGRKVVHLTMYGMPVQEVAPELRKLDKLLIVVGGPKVPGRVYHEADYNVAVTSQPHSEVAALAIVLHEIQEGEELKRTFRKSRLRILPSPRGKRVVEN
jgi:tRNA (cytidine56-2'-O)-methyltransferase